MKRKRRSVDTDAHDSSSIVCKNGKGTGICFDDRMTRHRHEWFFGEQESPARISRPFQLIQKQGLLNRCTRVPACHVPESALLKVHAQEYVSLVKDSAKVSKEELYDLSGKYDGVFFNSHTWEASSLAAGTVLQMTVQVATGKLENGLALVRPPGHHAMYDEACGYCFFGNVAIAAASLLDSPPLSVYNPQSLCPKTVSRDQLVQGPRFKRILILDWDVHQGQGTQYTFYNDNRVLFISIHRYEGRKFWPNLREGDFDFIGDGSGRGFNINIPLNKTGMTDSDYLAIFHTLIMPVAYEFDPEIVLVSSGFDAAIGDAEGKMWLSPACYGHMTHQLRTLAGGKLVVVLEGGYFVDSLERGCIHVLKSLLGDHVPSLQAQDPPSKSVQRTISSSIVALRQYWKCLNVVGLSRTIPRPDVSRFPSVSWPSVKVVNWPERNPTLSKSAMAFSQKLLRKLSKPLAKPTQGDIVFLLPVDKPNDLDRLFSRWTDSLKVHGVDSYQLQAYVETGVQAPSRGDSDVSTPQKKTRLKLNEKSSLESAPSLLKALENTVISLFKNEFTVALVAAKNISMATFISTFSQVPCDLLKKSLSTKFELLKRLPNQCSSKLHRPSPPFANPSESLESDSRLMYVDLTGDGGLDSQAFECLNQKQGKADSSKKISVMAFSFHYSGSELTLTSLNPQSSWVSVPLQCCRSPKAPICTHSVANMLAIMDFVILPMSYAFAPDLLVINVSDSTTKEGAGVSMVSRMHVVFLLKNVAYRLVVLTTPDIDPDPRFLHCLLHDAPPKPFEQGQSSCANLVIQERIQRYICSQKRRYKCFPITS